MNMNQTIGQNFRKLRELKGLDQNDMAIILDVGQSYYSQMECGKKNISIKKLVKVADEFSLPLDWFLGRNPEIDKKIRNQ